MPIGKFRYRAGWRRPLHGVLNYPHHVLVVIGWERLMPGAEINHPAGAARPGASGAEDFAAAEAADQEGTLGLGNVEEFAVHFLAGKDEVVLDSIDNGMAGAGHPENLALVQLLAPFEHATC